MVKNSKYFILLIPIVLILIGTIIVIMSHNNSYKTSEKIKIVAVENVYGDIAKQIGGDRVEVYSILSNPDSDPHEYESTFADSDNIFNASLVIENGIGYDSFVDKILSSSKNKDIKIINLGKEENLSLDDNPHLWYNFKYTIDLGGFIKDYLVAKDSNNKDYYDSNYDKFITSMNTLMFKSDAIKNKYAGTKVVYTERVAGYIIVNAGLSVIDTEFPKYIEDGVDPSVDSISKFQDALAHREAKLLFYNSQTISPLTKIMLDIASANNVPVIGVSESMPVNSNYESWMMSILNDIINKLSVVK